MNNSSNGIDGITNTTTTVTKKNSRSMRQRITRSYGTEKWKAPPFFRLVRIASDPADCAHVVSLRELLGGEFREALISTYLLKETLLFEEVPRLKRVPLIVVQGMDTRRCGVLFGGGGGVLIIRPAIASGHLVSQQYPGTERYNGFSVENTTHRQ